MKEELYNALSDEILSELNGLKDEEAGTEKHKVMVNEITEMFKVINNDEKMSTDLMKIEQEKKNNCMLIFVDLGKTLIKLGFEGTAMFILYQIEKEGYLSFTSTKSLFRKIIH